MNANDPSGTIEAHLRRWGWVAALVAIACLLLVTDRLPQLRGYRPWPPEWRWLHLAGSNLGALVPMAIAGTIVATCGWLADAAAKRGRRIAWVTVLTACALAYQLLAVSARGSDLGHFLGLRTTVDFLEDFFAAARGLDSAGESFTRYTTLAGSEWSHRVATHPPGLVWLYRCLIGMGAWIGDGALLDFSRRFFVGDRAAQGFSTAEATGLLLATAMKLLAGVATLAGVGIAARALAPDNRIEGRAMALAALVPAIAMFTVCIDSLAMAASTVGVACLLMASRSPKCIGWGAAAGAAFFLQSMLVYQVLASGFIAAVAVLLIARLGNEKSDWRRAGLGIAACGAAILLLWLFVYTVSGFNYPAQAIEGLSTHRRGAIHQFRSRWPWALWNLWDVFFFLGIAWIPQWTAAWKARRGAASALLFAIMAFLALLAVADTVRGETARILLFLFPLLAVGLSCAGSDGMRRTNFAWLSGLLIIQCIAFAAVLNLF